MKHRRGGIRLSVGEIQFTQDETRRGVGVPTRPVQVGLGYGEGEGGIGGSTWPLPSVGRPKCVIVAARWRQMISALSLSLSFSLSLRGLGQVTTRDSDQKAG
ncbi:hypothetical protein LSH36_70g01017 [Paralvinella palmiformis]|uniref:Uncharacterized protein n=1 Tax=Paralvinella palmiformis TaxID=53620 RepID=A0AAD9K4W4_9ANNE|nr:hypothetical protein LSH36_70g01017 [Paralvinella palmiformis]